MSELKKKEKKIEEIYNILNQYKELIDERIKDKETLEKIQLFKKRYSNYKNINRFCIPIIGKCNSGKTTFINFLLKQKVLEMNYEVNTKFICIIRHDSQLINPKIYKVNFIPRDKINGLQLYNFGEGEEIECAGNINKYIRDKNITVKKTDSKDFKDYFLIMKINIPFFNNVEFAPYANYIDLIDIPGLDEGEEGKFYITKLLPYFSNNLKFCFFIFNVEDNFDTNTKLLFEDIFKNIEDNKNIYEKSLFILNKIDLVDKDKDTYIEKFNDCIKNKTKIENPNYIHCNSRLLLTNNFKLKSFVNYLEYIYSKPKCNNDNDEIITSNIKEDFGNDIEQNEDQNKIEKKYNEEENKEYKDFEDNNILQGMSLDKLSKSAYFYYKKKFEENKKEINNNYIKEIIENENLLKKKI